MASCCDGSTMLEKVIKIHITPVPSGTLIHAAVWPQQIWAENWGCALFREEELGSHLTQYGQGRGLPPYQVAS